MNVLLISAWYPNRYDAMSGLFVRKHATAAGELCNLKVLYVHSSDAIKNTEINDIISGNITETIIYVPSSEIKLLKFFRIFWGYYKGYKKMLKIGFRPDVVHANILTRVPFFAFFVKILFGTPYIISEHWSRFLHGKKSFNSKLHKLITQLVVKNSEAVLVVSEILHQGMINAGLNHDKFIRINNVVDDFFFEKYDTPSTSVKMLLHISCFDEQAKNTSGIIRAVTKLSETRNDFKLVIAGGGMDFSKVNEFAKSQKVTDELIEFTGEKTPQEIAALLRKSCCLVQFSNYETAGVTIAEALASGKPVVSSKVGIAPEYINETNGILIEPGNEKALEVAINTMLDNYNMYNQSVIRENARELFSFDTVAKKLNEIYIEAVKK